MQLLRPLVKTWIEDEDASLTGKCLRMAGFAVFIIPFGFFGLAGRLFIFCLLLGLSYLVELRLGRAAGWISGALLYRGWVAWRTSHSYTVVCVVLALLLIGLGSWLTARTRRKQAEALEWKTP